MKAEPPRQICRLCSGIVHVAAGYIAADGNWQHLDCPNPHAVALGRLGGAAKSERKTLAVRENAKRPRPNARGKRG